MPEPLNKSESERVNGEEETLDFDKPDFMFLPQGNHEWRQQGTYLVCKSCEIQHAVWIGTEKIMVGLNDKGQPILKKKDGLS
ncbi:MAG: hypothetical protein FJ006_11340 [Chloroflexi bacterium]|nr:hypothetical protein [Chloroflexota bacterium]